MLAALMTEIIEIPSVIKRSIPVKEKFLTSKRSGKERIEMKILIPDKYSDIDSVPKSFFSVMVASDLKPAARIAINTHDIIANHSNIYCIELSLRTVILYICEKLPKASWCENENSPKDFSKDW